MYTIVALRDDQVVGSTCQYRNLAGAAHEARFSWPGSTYEVYKTEMHRSVYCGELFNEKGCDVIRDWRKYSQASNS